jgi:hypothetical protein
MNRRVITAVASIIEWLLMILALLGLTLLLAISIFLGADAGYAPAMRMLFGLIVGLASLRLLKVYGLKAGMTFSPLELVCLIGILLIALTIAAPKMTTSFTPAKADPLPSRIRDNRAEQARGEDGEPAAAPTTPSEDHPSRRPPQ